MLETVILGTGNVAQHLFDAFSENDQVSIKQVVGRNEKSLSYFKKKTKTGLDFQAIEDADIYVIAVNDDAISTVSAFIASKTAVTVHTSGSIPIGALTAKRRGVFYPLQTFTKGKPVDFKNIPICIEAESQMDLDLLNQLASTISDHVYQISSEQRKYLHLSAVFANNFTNHLFDIANQICTENKIPFSILEPLMCETVKKAHIVTPFDAQTGPAKRADLQVMEQHMHLLKNDLHKRVYALLSQSIQTAHGKKL